MTRLWIATVLLVACAKDDPTPNRTDTDPTSPPELAWTADVVGPDGGDVVLQTNTGSFTLTLPPGAVWTDTEITVSEVAHDALSVRIEPAGLQLKAPADVRLPSLGRSGRHGQPLLRGSDRADLRPLERRRRRRQRVSSVPGLPRREHGPIRRRPGRGRHAPGRPGSQLRHPGGWCRDRHRAHDPPGQPDALPGPRAGHHRHRRDVCRRKHPVPARRGGRLGPGRPRSPVPGLPRREGTTPTS